ncbi:MAG: PIN domain-containing protein [Candidatus Rokuibacteriota bacterium]
MAGNVFVDTNILVYCRDTSETDKQRRAESWMAHLWTSRRGRLSYQVLQEFYVTVTEKLAPGLDRQTARREIRTLLPWRPLAIDGRVLEGAWGVQDRYRLSWWDALIISAAQLAHCRYLLTEDLQDHQQLGSLLVINPFRVTPDEL